MVNRDAQDATDELGRLLTDASARGGSYLAQVRIRRVVPSASALEHLSELGAPLPRAGASPIEALRLLDDIGSPATAASAGGRYFGLVIGSAPPATDRNIFGERRP